jgi:uncharacterized membrane protein (UPF0127 family)
MPPWLRKYLFPPVATVRILRGGAVLAVYHLEVAATIWRRARGLMGRRNLTAEGGMLFVYPWRRVVRIWMADTPISLDVLFVAPDGDIVKIAPNLPPSSPRWTSSEVSVRWVIEVAAGTAAGCGIDVGDQVRIDYVEV